MVSWLIAMCCRRKLCNRRTHEPLSPNLPTVELLKIVEQSENGRKLDRSLGVNDGIIYPLSTKLQLHLDGTSKMYHHHLEIDGKIWLLSTDGDVNMWSLDAMLQFEAAARTHCNFGPFILAATDVLLRSLQSLPLSLAAVKRSLRVVDPTQREMECWLHVFPLLQ